MISRPPALQLIVELEELPIVRIVADTWENEERLRTWLDHPTTKARLFACVQDALDELGRAA